MMPIKMRVVGVTQIPKLRNARDGRLFLRDFRGLIKDDRPRLVLDCSKVPQLDRSVILLLLCCLEEAMKCNGDIKLADLPPGSEEILQKTGAKRLFEIYQTTAEAVSSFHQSAARIVSRASEVMPSPAGSEIVA